MNCVQKELSSDISSMLQLTFSEIKKFINNENNKINIFFFIIASLCYINNEHQSCHLYFLINQLVKEEMF